MALAQRVGILFYVLRPCECPSFPWAAWLLSVLEIVLDRESYSGQG